MSLLKNVSDKLALRLHELTYDPEAEQFAKEQKDTQYERQRIAQEEAEKDKAISLAAKEEEAQRKKRLADLEERKAKSVFSNKRLIGKVTGIVGTTLLIFLLVIGGIFGASLATNLNIYRSWPYRLLYSVYGFIFFPIVVLYVFFYRWLWLGKSPHFYSFIPLIPYEIESPRWLQMLLTPFCFRPDNLIHSLKEWEQPTCESLISSVA
jgi:hypothetical protein